MDKNTVTGIVLIFLILIGFSYFNRPSKEELAAAKHRSDSLQQVELTRQLQAEEEIKKQENILSASDTSANNISVEAITNERKEKYGGVRRCLCW